MADNDSKVKSRAVTATFQSTGDSALGPDEVFVRRFTGREAISKLYEFDVLLERADGPLPSARMDALLEGTATVRFEWEGESDVPFPSVHGVVCEVESEDLEERGSASYRVRVVPALWRTTQCVRTRLFQGLSVPEIVTHILAKDYNFKQGAADGDDFELRLARAYDTEEYVLQYQETDFEFICRQLEHQGVFFFFDQGTSRERLVISDANTSFRADADPSFPTEGGFRELVFDPRGGTTDPLRRLESFTHVVRSVPLSVTIQDYNHNTPATDLSYRAMTDVPSGSGHHHYYLDRFQSVAEGKRISKARAELLAVQRDTYRGVSSAIGMHPGNKFVVSDHPQEDIAYDGKEPRKYVVTSMTHSLEQSAQELAGGDEASKRPRGYRTEFTAALFKLAYRPPRVTPRPLIHGVINARVADPGAAAAAHLDAAGRYQLVLPFDTVGGGGHITLKWFRMAQPFSGAGYGIHFPLHKGTEVLLVHLGGDPDEPVIAASVPNADTPSPITAANPTHGGYKTRAGIVDVYNDEA